MERVFENLLNPLTAKPPDTHEVYLDVKQTLTTDDVLVKIFALWWENKNFFRYSSNLYSGFASLLY